MSTVSIAELRQNPTPALDAVERGETLDVTRYRRAIARLVPVVDSQVSGLDVMQVLSATLADPGWAAELDNQRQDDAWGNL